MSKHTLTLVAYDSSFEPKEFHSPFDCEAIVKFIEANTKADVTGTIGDRHFSWATTILVHGYSLNNRVCAMRSQIQSSLVHEVLKGAFK